MPGRRNRRIAWIAGVLALAAVIALLTLLPSRAPLPNPAMAFRVLPIPFPEVGTPGLSRDGNWAAYPAADANGRYNIYYSNTASGKSRCLTSDSAMFMNDADISPDGSWIVYDRFDAAREKWEIAVVSPLGDASLKVTDDGQFPRWRADGQRIGYMRGKDRGSQSGKAEFWTVRQNGSDNRCELVDPASDQTAPFAWSPDGRSICWIRNLNHDNGEIFIHELSDGKERRLTFDKKSIADVCWAANGQIIFSSNRSGNFNLWTVPETGGEPAPITKGAGPDYSAAISHDGSKLLCYQMQELSNIWIAGTGGSRPRQVTFGDAYFWRVAFSADGKEIVSGYYQLLGSARGAFVCSMDREGGNRRELTPGEESINNPLPSPDGRWIIYGRHALNSSSEDSMVHILDAQNPGLPRSAGKGVPYRWIDDKSFISFDISSQTTWINRIDGAKPEKFFQDSTLAIPLQGGKYIAYYDYRSGQKGRWIATAPGVKDPALPSARELLSPYYGEFDKTGKFFYYVRNAGELRRVSIPSGKEEVIPAVFPGLSPEFYHSSFDISYDGKEIVYTNASYNGKLVMIEDPFQ